RSPRSMMRLQWPAMSAGRCVEESVQILEWERQGPPGKIGKVSRHAASASDTLPHVHPETAAQDSSRRPLPMTDPGRTLCHLLAPVLIVRAGGAGAGAAPGPDASPPPQGGVLTIDPTLRRKIETARDYIAERSWPEAVRLLQAVLESPQDSF